MIIAICLIIWILCAIDVSARDVNRVMEMSVFQFFLWMTSIALASPIVLIYDLIKNGWNNDR